MLVGVARAYTVQQSPVPKRLAERLVALRSVRPSSRVSTTHIVFRTRLAFSKRPAVQSIRWLGDIVWLHADRVCWRGSRARKAQRRADDEEKCKPAVSAYRPCLQAHLCPKCLRIMLAEWWEGS